VLAAAAGEEGSEGSGGLAEGEQQAQVVDGLEDGAGGGLGALE
jgi:hypothetical protein